MLIMNAPSFEMYQMAIIHFKPFASHAPEGNCDKDSVCDTYIMVVW